MSIFVALSCSVVSLNSLFIKNTLFMCSQRLVLLVVLPTNSIVFTNICVSLFKTIWTHNSLCKTIKFSKTTVVIYTFLWGIKAVCYLWICLMNLQMNFQILIGYWFKFKYIKRQWTFQDVWKMTDLSHFNFAQQILAFLKFYDLEYWLNYGNPYKSFCVYVTYIVLI